MKIYTKAFVLFLTIYSGAAYSETVDSELKYAQSLAAQYSSLKIVEAEDGLLVGARGKAERHNENLVLHLSRGDKNLINKKECRSVEREVECVRYVFMAYSAVIHLFVVAELPSEGWRFLLVDEKSGNSFYVKNFPIFSPNGQRFVVVRESAIDGNFGLELWVKKNNTYALDWEGSPFYGGYYASYKINKWIDGNAIDVSMTNEDGPKNSSYRFSLKYVGNKWQVISKCTQQGCTEQN